jgi:hypothetical protein
MRRWFFSELAIQLAIITAASVFASGDALAQAGPPFGTWGSTAGPATLYVSPQICYFESRVRNYRIQGTCSWNPSYNGGILTIYNASQSNAPIYENIVYVDDTTISVWGEIFRRQY